MRNGRLISGQQQYSARKVAMVASHMAAGSSHPDEQGYITALRVDAAICALSAVRSWLSSHAAIA